MVFACHGIPILKGACTNILESSRGIAKPDTQQLSGEGTLSRCWPSLLLTVQCERLAVVLRHAAESLCKALTHFQHTDLLEH